MALEGNNPINDPGKKPIKGRSTFQPNRSFYQSLLFGLNQPHFAMETVEGDQISVRVKTDLDTYNLRAPLMTPVKMNKDYFFVSLRSILPNAAELLVTNPLSGDDVVAEDVNCVLTRSRFYDGVGHLVTALNSDLAAASNASTTKLADAYLIRAYIAAVTIGDLLASDGSLLNYLGIATGKMILAWTDSNGGYHYFDEFVELLASRIIKDVDYFYASSTYAMEASGNYSTTSEGSVCVYTGKAPKDSFPGSISFRQWVEMIHQGKVFTKVYSVHFKSDLDTTQKALLDGDGASLTAVIRVPSSSAAEALARHINFSRAVAYQIASASFYTNDAVDYVYSAQMWHQNQLTLSMYARATSYNWKPALGNLKFKVNGVGIDYDSVAGYVLQQIFSNLSSKVFKTDAITASDVETSTGFGSLLSDCQCCGTVAYLNNLLGYTRSLKYRDYFVGAKPNPMAVGNVEVTVASSKFSVVDVTKNIQMQRFLNQVNRVGRKFSEYVRGIFGASPAHDPCEPIFLGHTQDVIGAEEVENTGAAQLTDPQTTTSKLRMNSSRFAFEGSFAEPGILIGITNFDVIRPYLDASDRATFHVDRFDMFNPFLQQIGDQEVSKMELLPEGNGNFGYKPRYCEYKMAIDRAVGAFRAFLPGYAFVNYDGLYSDPFTSSNLVISPDFIRSRPCEFDRFYVSLTHFSQAGYFHFIARQDIECTAHRNMEANPSIL